MRIDKYLSQRTAFSRLSVKELIAAKKVKVNNIVVLKSDMEVTETDTVTISGNAVRQKEFLIIAMNKPAGCISATEDRSEKTVIDLLPQEYRNQGLSPVGRLDKDTTGLLLLTNDGDLLHRLTSPKKHVPKYYIASLARQFTEETLNLIENGILLKDGTKCMPAKAAAIDKDCREILICINEGKYHQVKRMLAAAGNHVESLSRVAIGNFIIPDDLQLGETSILSDKDLCKVLKTEDIFLSLVHLFGKYSS